MVTNLFMGNALCAVEADGAMLLPEFVRAVLALQPGPVTILLGSHESDNCLVACDPALAPAIQLDCQRRRIAEEMSKPCACHARARRIFGLLQAVTVDADGRCVLPELLRRRARISETVLVVGTGDAFEIWGPKVALYGHDVGMRTLAALCLDLP